MAGTSPAEWLRLIVANAEALRSAGVRRVKLSGAEFEIAAPEPQVVRIDAEETDYGDPLDDPATFGGKLPGFPRRHRRESDA